MTKLPSPSQQFRLSTTDTSGLKPVLYCDSNGSGPSSTLQPHETGEIDTGGRQAEQQELLQEDSCICLELRYNTQRWDIFQMPTNIHMNGVSLIR